MVICHICDLVLKRGKNSNWLKCMPELFFAHSHIVHIYSCIDKVLYLFLVIRIHGNYLESPDRLFLTTWTNL